MPARAASTAKNGAPPGTADFDGYLGDGFPVVQPAVRDRLSREVYEFGEKADCGRVGRDRSQFVE